ncbi:hypothetical protein O181_057857 [Austropuccinia psidii MF-1]|uniref:Integrase catalytic domain-containing protein n=1 Tax=Austropuccinia psidii MF-1 TaxID=1389203 RepID=A0A9Q3HVV3_9BASI|nr:hypothetical protein [Austropuccinia psidii MF-1]
MNIVHKARNIHIDADSLSIWELTNTPNNPAYVPENEEPQISIEGINITDLGTEFFEEVRERYKKDKSFHIPGTFLEKDCKCPFLANYLDDIWKTLYNNGIFHLSDGILYHRSKHTCVMVLCSRMLINTIVLECHENIYSRYLSEDRTICDRFRKANKATGKRFGLIIHIHKPSTPWKVVHLDWVTSLPPGGEKGSNACLFIVDRYSKTPIFLPCHEDDTAMDTALLIWNRVISHTGLFKNIISDRGPRFTLALWKNLHKRLGTKRSFSTSYHPQTDGLAEGMIQTLEDMIRRLFSYFLKVKYSDSFTHGWCTLMPELE